MENQSRIDPSRKTVGAIYRDAAINNTEKSVTNGDLTNELISSLVEDLNDAIIEGRKDFKGESFYLLIHEKKDLQMPRAIHRKIVKLQMRPYPEDDTIVYWANPQSNTIKFCWCLPHWAEMDNILDNYNLYVKEYVDQIRSWKQENLYNFGFRKDELGNWEPNPFYQGDQDISSFRKTKILMPS